jgi:methylated-DNA-[protein]-cysteine S-methyltransferase
MDERELQRLREVVGSPPEAAVATSRRRVERWFAQTAPLIQWDMIESPLGPLYVAASPKGLCALDFGVSQAIFLGRLDALARTARDPVALAPITAQLRAYFAGEQFKFDLSLDLERLTPFQRSVLQAASRIPVGTVWTYGQVAQAIGKPQASRAVGQALGHNPVPIVIPCHRVIASDGRLGGYSGSGSLESKKWLLSLEGAL